MYTFPKIGKNWFQNFDCAEGAARTDEKAQSAGSG
jgi:hypothetical protein